ncbi:hypothetical protein CMUS01_01421 [Colletotrichum musicola]|uniref:Uncharacterized protein n=1 Tax=Colletotrichum musicola TaxID=2175873 RepID=A0A8H6NWV0_9PEZI|nr:hypothetical protein CMUS01_01421 [Colletotrichum musicola]
MESRFLQQTRSSRRAVFPVAGGAQALCGVRCGLRIPYHRGPGSSVCDGGSGANLEDPAVGLVATPWPSEDQPSRRRIRDFEGNNEQADAAESELTTQRRTQCTISGSRPPHRVDPILPEERRPLPPLNLQAQAHRAQTLLSLGTGGTDKKRDLTGEIRPIYPPIIH